MTNTLSPGDTVLMYETGQFATLWKGMAERIGLKTDFIPSGLAHRRRSGQKIEEKLRADKGHEIKAVCVSSITRRRAACSPISRRSAR